MKTPCDELAIPAGPAAPADPVRERWVLVVAVLGSGMAFIDGTAVNLALPVLQREFAAGLAELQWVVEGYILFLSALLLVGGALGDRFGRRRVFALGILLFGLASALCGLAPSMEVLILARAAQGIGGALLVPGSLALISAAIPPARRGPAVGLWGGLTSVFTAAGPVLGGWVIEQLSWRAVFFLNLPLATLALVAVFARVAESRDPAAEGALDWPGALLATLGLGGVVTGLIAISTEGWTALSVRLPLLVGGAALVAFFVVEARAPRPMLPLALFRSPAFSGINLLTFLLYAALSGTLFFLPFTLMQVGGYSATAAGLALLPFVLVMSLLSRWAGGLVSRYGARLLLVVGPLLTALGFVWLALPLGESYWWSIFPGMVVLGVGMGVTVPPLTTTVLNAVEQRHAGIASGVNNAVTRVAGLLAIALLSLLVATVFTHELEQRLEQLEVPAAVRTEVLAQRASLAALPVPAAVPDRPALERAIAEAYLTGYRLALLSGALLALAGAVVAAVFLPASAFPPAGER